MTTIKAESVFGNFKWTAEAAVSDEQRDALAAFGLTQVLQRSPASAAEKAMAGYDKRPEKFQRGSILYDEGKAALLKTHLEGAKVDIAGKEQGLAVEITVVQYVPTTAEASKEAKELHAARVASGTLAKLAANVGYAGDDIMAATPSTAFLSAIQAKLAAIKREAIRQAKEAGL